MDVFLKSFETYGASKGARPDFYTMVSYIQGALALEAAKAAIAANDISPDGYAKALRSISGFNAGGMIKPLDLTKFPYETSTTARILKPDFEKKSLTQCCLRLRSADGTRCSSTCGSCG